MILIGLIGLCAGVVLALIFRVSILVPTTLVAAAGIVLAGLALRQNLAHALLAGGISACALQFGYLLGLSFRPIGNDPAATEGLAPDAVTIHEQS